MSTTAPEKKTLEQAHAERDEAMDRARRGTDPEWAAKAAEAIRDLATVEELTGDPFTADDVWELLESRQVPAPREPRALGPILRALSTPGGPILGVGYAPSRRRHGSPVMSYRSRAI
jgi:hypothetical protein